MSSVPLDFDTNVPIPAHRRGQRYDFSRMAVGHSIFRTLDNGAKSLETALRAYGNRARQRGESFKVVARRERNGSGEEGLRLFRVE